jgi:hypothetical protein
MFCLGSFLTIGGVIMAISVLTNGNEDYISEPEEKLIDHSVDDLPAITLVIKNERNFPLVLSPLLADRIMRSSRLQGVSRDFQ